MLDCGCGTGQAILRFGLTQNGFDSVVGIDHSRSMLDALRQKLHETQKSRIRLIQDDVIEWLARGEESGFDLITAIGFLHHLSDEQVVQTLRLMTERVGPGGQIVIAEPMIDEKLSEPALIRWWNRHSLARGAGYSTPADEPDERPLPRNLLYSAFDQARLRVEAHTSSWEIFNRSTRPGWTERSLIGLLYRWGGPGIVNAWKLQPIVDEGQA
ncbi:MAG: class I SAM-dependent methyltransferase [Xanthomonadales bacterium]|nr:class I SAM-dependent methyltransferase [Xanthomonadales bacterium]